ncbi:hypothetical protein BD779DRAFT_1452767 [Infundibulicybe gibba]|nr:hypothetical protein BD779DRAFT_1452767 [Infundibulicybe gibba]
MIFPPTAHSPSSSLDGSELGLTPPLVKGGYFAFARINGVVCLVQVSLETPASALTTVDVKIFRHEFITIFRFSETRTFHPADITIIETIDDRLTRYEEENETVFLARDLMERMRKLTDQRLAPQARWYRSQIRRQRC